VIFEKRFVYSSFQKEESCGIAEDKEDAFCEAIFIDILQNGDIPQQSLRYGFCSLLYPLEIENIFE